MDTLVNCPHEKLFFPALPAHPHRNAARFVVGLARLCPDCEQKVVPLFQCTVLDGEPACAWVCYFDPTDPAQQP